MRNRPYPVVMLKCSRAGCSSGRDANTKAQRSSPARRGKFFMTAGQAPPGRLLPTAGTAVCLSYTAVMHAILFLGAILVLAWDERLTEQLLGEQNRRAAEAAAAKAAGGGKKKGGGRSKKKTVSKSFGESLSLQSHGHF